MTFQDTVTTEPTLFFASDNGAPVHPKVMQAMADANRGMAMPYGNDPLTAAAARQIRDLFEAPEAAVHFVGSGTAANALSLALLSPAWGGVYCHPLAHINNDECGAPEFFTAGAKLLPVPGAEGRIDPDALRATLAGMSTSVHTVQGAALSLTNLTEIGTAYEAAQVAALAGIARAAGLGVHLDGSRLANALAATGASPAEMTWKAGIDVLSLGGAKGGMMNAEAVVIFDPAKAREFELRRKRAGQLTSKMRFHAAQFQGWLDEGLWLDLGRHANAMAERMRQGLGPDRLLAAGTGNIVFADIPEAAQDRLRARGALFYNSRTVRTREGLPACRMVCSWATHPVDVDAFLEAVG